MAAILLSVVVILALVYFFRPSTFNFLKMTQGFEDDLDENFENSEEDLEDFENLDKDKEEDFENLEEDFEEDSE